MHKRLREHDDSRQIAGYTKDIRIDQPRRNRSPRTRIKMTSARDHAPTHCRLIPCFKRPRDSLADICPRSSVRSKKREPTWRWNQDGMQVTHGF
jgi:hypothetical protein